MRTAHFQDERPHWHSVILAQFTLVEIKRGSFFFSGVFSLHKTRSYPVNGIFLLLFRGKKFLHIWPNFFFIIYKENIFHKWLTNMSVFDEICLLFSLGGGRGKVPKEEDV